MHESPTPAASSPAVPLDSPTLTLDSPEVVAAQRSTMRALAVTQLFIGGAVTASIAVSTLLAADLLGGATWAGLSGGSYTVGTAMGAQLLARVGRSSGRRASLMVGLTVGALGAVLATVGASTKCVWLYFFGLCLAGFANSSGLQARYGAADLSAVSRRARSVGLIVWALTVGAVLGPHLVGPMKPVARWFGVPPLTGPLMATAVLAIVAAVVAWALLRPDPLLFAKEHGLLAPTVGRAPRGAAFGAIRGSSHAKLAVFGLAIAQMTMVAVMSMTPVHLRDGHSSDELIAGVISLHVLGMYIGAPVWGWVADRIGRIRALSIAAAVLAVASGLAASAEPTNHGRLMVALFLLGVGWSIGLVSSSTLLTEAVAAEDRVAVQGFADSTTSLCGGTAALLSGQIVGSFGYSNLSLVSFVLAFGLFLVALPVAMRGIRPAA